MNVLDLDICRYIDDFCFTVDCHSHDMVFGMNIFDGDLTFVCLFFFYIWKARERSYSMGLEVRLLSRTIKTSNKKWTAKSSSNKH